jgi:hypothetical protein
VSSGDFWYLFLLGVSSVSELGVELTSSVSSGFPSRGPDGDGDDASRRGVVTDPFDGRRSVKERVEELGGIEGFV